VKALVHNRDLPRSFPERGVAPVRGDVRLPATLAPSMDGCDTVIQLVGVIAEKRGASFYQVHYLGTLNAVEAALQAGVKRYLHMSALGVRDDASRSSRYHSTKLMAERYVMVSGLDYTILRPSVIFGPRDAFINMLARMIKFLPVVPVIGPGNGRLQPIWVDDVAACFTRALSKPSSVGKIYELGGPSQYTFNELIDTVANSMGKKRSKVHIPLPLVRPIAAAMEFALPKPPLTRDQIKMLQQDNVCDNTPMINELGVRPAPLEEIMPGYLK